MTDWLPMASPAVAIPPGLGTLYIRFNPPGLPETSSTDVTVALPGRMRVADGSVPTALLAASAESPAGRATPTARRGSRLAGR